MHIIDGCSDSSDDENKECLAAKIRWPAENKLVTCASLKPIHKNQNEEVKFTFDFSKMTESLMNCLNSVILELIIHCHYLRS